MFIKHAKCYTEGLHVWHITRRGIVRVGLHVSWTLDEGFFKSVGCCKARPHIERIAAKGAARG